MKRGIGTEHYIEGVLHRVVDGREVPSRYIDKLTQEQRTPTPTLCAVIYRETIGHEWEPYQYLPTDLYARGDWCSGPYQECYGVLVPVSYLEVEINEFGKAMP